MVDNDKRTSLIEDGVKYNGKRFIVLSLGVAKAIKSGVKLIKNFTQVTLQ